MEDIVQQIINKIEEIFAVDHLPVSDYNELIGLVRILQVTK